MASKNPHQKPQQGPSQNQILAQQWSGPLPPPAALEHFNTIIHNGAERIMAMVEIEQAHRLESEAKVLNARITDTRRGTWIGGVLIALSIAAAVYTAFIGAHPAVSIALVGLPLGIIIRALLGNKSNSK